MVDSEDLAKRLRDEAAKLVGLPETTALLLEAAEHILSLDAQCESYYYDAMEDRI